MLGRIYCDHGRFTDSPCEFCSPLARRGWDIMREALPASMGLIGPKCRRCEKRVRAPLAYVDRDDAAVVLVYECHGQRCVVKVPSNVLLDGQLEDALPRELFEPPPGEGWDANGSFVHG